MPLDEGGGESLVVSGVVGWWGTNFALVEEGIYFIAEPGPDGLHSIQFFDFATEETTLVVPAGRSDQGLAISPDGRSILYALQNPGGNDIMLIESFR